MTKPKYMGAASALILSFACMQMAYAEDVASSAPGAIALEQIDIFGKQEPYFEKARSTALKTETTDLETPFTTTVINEAALEDLKATTLEESYSYIPGLSRSGVTANGFTLRGFTADLQNVQVDGLPGLVSRMGAPVTANIDRVEILKGPASVLYGWMDPGGMMNIITKKPEAEANNSIQLSAQRFVDQGENGFAGSVDLTGPLNDEGTILYRFIAGTEIEDSFRNHVDTETFYLFPSLSFLMSNDTRLDVQLEYLKDNRSADNGLFVANLNIDTVADIETYYQEPGDTDNDEGLALSGHLSHRFNDSLSGSIKVRSVFHEDERDLYESNRVVNAVAVEDTEIYRRNRHQYNEREYHFIDANLAASFGNDSIWHEMLIGVNGGYEYRQYDRLAFDTRGANLNIYNPIYTGDVLADDPQSFRKWNLYNYGLYASDKISFGEQWTVVLGARLDYQEGDYKLRYLDSATTADEESSTFSPTFSGGVVYQPMEEVSLYASYGQSFNPQTVAKFDINNEQLDAETGEQYEAGVKLSLIDGLLNVNIAYFDLTKANIAEENPVTGFDELVGTINSKGVEVMVQHQISPDFQFQASYVFMDAKVTESYDADILGNRAAFAPEHSASFLMRYNYPRQVLGGLLGASLGVTYETERYTDEDINKRVSLPGYTRIDTGVYYEVDDMKWALNVNNLTNETYYTGGTNDYRIYAGDPMKASLSVQFDF